MRKKAVRGQLSVVGWALAVALVAAASVFAQVAEDKTEVAPDRVHFGPPSTIHFRVGVDVSATKGAARDIKLFVAVPFECPEQEVKSIDEDFSSEVSSVDYRMVQGGARQMLVTIPRLADGASAHAIVTFEVSTHPILPPEKRLRPLRRWNSQSRFRR